MSPETAAALNSDKLPNCLVIGAPRSGTTSLYEYLQAHPEVFMSPVKEPDFFADPSFAAVTSPDPDGGTASEVDPKLAAEHLQRLEAYMALFSGAAGAKIRGEASAVYLPYADAATNIRRYVPDVKMIAILRDPAERYHSHYEHTQRIRRESGASEEESRRLQEEFHAVVDRAHAGQTEGLGDTEPGWWLQIGYYHQHLARFRSIFPEAQLRVFLFEDLVRDGKGLMTEIYRYLEVDDAFVLPTTAAFNATVVPRNSGLFRLFTKHNPAIRFLRSIAPASLRGAAVRARNSTLGSGKPTLDPEMRRKLIDIYRKDIEQLQGQLSRDLSAWLQ